MLAGDRRVERGHQLDAGDAALLGVEAGGVELDPADAHRLQLHLGLPLVDLGQRLGRQRGEEALRPELDQPRLRLAEFGLPKPSEHSEAMISVPPGSRMSSGVTMPLTVW